MKVGRTREQLENELRKSIFDLNVDRNHKDKVVNKLMTRGYIHGEVEQVIGGNTPLEMLHDVEIGVFADAIFKVTDNVLVSPQNYYTDIELREIEDYNLEVTDERREKKLVFSNMQQQSSDQWVGLISVKRLVDLFQAKKVRYNYKTQRNALQVKHRGEIIKRPNLNQQSITEISQEMVAGTYIYDTITLNIFAEEFDIPTFNTNTSDLIIPEGIVDITDGMHRSKAAEMAMLQNPNITGNFILMVTYFDTAKANDYIVQVDKRNPLDAEFRESIDMSSLNNDVVKRINEDTRSDLRGLIATNETMIKEGLSLTSFSVMSKTIEKLWNPSNRSEVRRISDYLIEFFNELVGILGNELLDNKNYSLINHHNMFIYYLAIAKELEDKENWINSLESIIAKTDFNNKDEWKGYVTYVEERRFNNRLPHILKHYKNKISRLGV